MTEMICVSADGPDHAGLRRPVPRRAHGGVEADRRLRPRARRREDRLPARALGAQGLDEAHVGGRGRAARRGQLAAARAVAAALPAGRQPGPARDDARRHGRGARRLRGRDAARGRGRVRPARGPHGARLPAVVVPLAADQRARRTSTAARSRTARASRSRSSPRAARCGRRRSRCPCASRRTDWCRRRLRRRRRGRVRAPAARAPAATSSTSRRGQVSPDQQPAYGRSFQTPFADRIRHEAGIPAIAVGAISSYDDVNTIILAGRADLCALARPHLYDPHWTLHAAADQGVDVEWIPQYRSGPRPPHDGQGDAAPGAGAALRRGAARRRAAGAVAAAGVGVSRVVVVTGGKRGIGARDRGALRRRGRPWSSRSSARTCDVTDEAAVAACFERARSRRRARQQRRRVVQRAARAHDARRLAARSSTSTRPARSCARARCCRGMRERDSRPDRHRRVDRPAAPARATPPRTRRPSTRRVGLDARGRGRGRRHRRDRERRLPGLRAHAT